MGRWQPDSRGRLQEAALALYSERGFDQTTVAQIAVRAGLTERTFFRHFADKREVLFGRDELSHLLADAITSAPDQASPIDAVAEALNAAATVFTPERREWVQQRQAVITANSELRERELLKSAAISEAMADALRKRGVPDPTASLAAEFGNLAVRNTFLRWTDEANQQDFTSVAAEELEKLRAARSAL
jgi:AcrR family transcriptional regulator